MRKLISLYLIVLAPAAFAQDVQNTTEQSMASQNTTINSTVTGTAQDWNLTQDEWIKYIKLMHGSNGKWYPQLSPAAVLGLNAKNPQEEQHYAEIVAKGEHDKLARELNFNNKVHQAVLRLYPEEPLIKPFDLSPFNPIQPKSKNTHALQAGDHIAFFTDPNKTLDALIVPQLIKAIQENSEIVLDVYCVGNGDDNAIRSWAKVNRIPLDLVSQGRVTLNHDNGKLHKTAGNVQLPYIVRVRSGQSQPISPWSLS